MGIKIFVVLISCFLVGTVQGQDSFWKRDKKFELPKITVTKSGPYIGLQRGKFNVLEFGLEGQYKKVKLIKPVTHALHMGFNYNFYKNVLGYDVGYWFKLGRVNLTYGVNFVYRTDFDQSRIGVIPVVGYKFWQLHLQTGMHIMTRATPTFPTNILFVSLRFVIINQRDVDIKK
ncbi:MAG: hypothetical protein KJ941_11835 [Bacteroidetes bacterium]|nr:hypothetical protein [Bacteroidota bacterium]